MRKTSKPAKIKWDEVPAYLRRLEPFVHATGMFRGGWASDKNGHDEFVVEVNQWRDAGPREWVTVARIAAQVGRVPRLTYRVPGAWSTATAGKVGGVSQAMARMRARVDEVIGK